MKLVRRLRTVILSEIVFLLLLFIIVERNGYAPEMIPAVILIQAGMLVYLAAAVYIPVKNFAETPDGFTQKERETGERQRRLHAERRYNG